MTVIADVTDFIHQEKAAERYPPLFKRLPDRLFAPLASANRFQYWSLLCVLHAKRFGPEAPLPPVVGFLTREITADIAQELQYQNWLPESEEEVTPTTPLAVRSLAVFNRLRESGWIRIDRVGVREMVTMPPTVVHFLNRLVEFAHTGAEFVSGKIRSIEANLTLLINTDADGASLQEVAQQTRALLESVRSAATNVRDLMVEIGRVAATREFVHRFFTDYVERMFIGDYKELRTQEHPLSRRQEILRLAAYIQQTPDLRARLIQWYLEKQTRGDTTRAEALFTRDIQKIEELSRIDAYLERLDDEIRRANRMALAYLDYRLRAVRPLTALIGQAIDAVVTHGSKAAELTPFAPARCISAERLAAPRVKTVRPPPSRLRKRVISPEQAARAALDVRARDRRMMSPSKLAAFVRQQLGAADAIPSTSLPIDSIEAVRALQLLATIAAANATTSPSQHAYARIMSNGFTAIRTSGEEIKDKGISHLPFRIIAAKPTPVGRRQR